MAPLGSSENARWESSQDPDEKHSVDHVEVHDKGISSPDFPKTLYPNRMAKYRANLREAVAEFLGVAMLVIFGAGVDCQVVLSSNPRVAPSPKGDYISINFGWAVGTAIGVWVSGGISGGHINPAVTLAFAVFREFPWKKVPIYIFSQVMGGVMGAALVYWNYFHAIDIFEGGEGVRTLKTASLFATYALDYMTNVSCFWSEFLGTAVLVVSVFAMTDKNNMPPPNGLAPLMLFILILGIGASLGMETGYAINPARDLGPRLLTSMVGYGGQVYTFRHHYWLWCPVMGPLLGALSGGLFYDLLLYTGEENIFNKWNSYFGRRNRSGLGRSQQSAGPADRTTERLV